MGFVTFTWLIVDGIPGASNELHGVEGVRT